MIEQFDMRQGEKKSSKQSSFLQNCVIVRVVVYLATPNKLLNLNHIKEKFRRTDQIIIGDFNLD